MPGLLDVARSFRKVTVNDVAVDVPGISAEGIAYLFTRFPIVRELIGGKPDVDLSPATLAQLAPDALAAVIAVGTGNIDSPAHEAVARGLPVESQLDLLQAIITETMPSGFGPFVERLTRLANEAASVVEPMSIPGGTSQSVLKN